MVKIISRNIAKLFDVAYSLKFVIKFLGFFFLLNFFHHFWIGITVPGGEVYVPFLDRYLNYIVFIKTSLLKSAVFFADLIGVHSFTDSTDTVKVAGAGGLYMGRPCYGLEVMSFWTAFIFADTTSFRKKLLWCLGGLFCIWLINCLRITLMLAALKNKWQILYMDHHQLFNIFAYVFVFLLIIFYYKKNKKQFGT